MAGQHPRLKSFGPDQQPTPASAEPFTPSASASGGAASSHSVSAASGRIWRSDLLARGAELPQGQPSLRIHLIFWMIVAAMALIVACVQIDRGGVIATREQQIEAFGDRRIEIRGTCLSACTLQLGAKNVCVDPSARLGFHGPSASGTPLEPQEFERWSQRMAAYYREPLRSRFLDEWRHDISKAHYVSGAELISLGYEPC